MRGLSIVLLLLALLFSPTAQAQTCQVVPLAQLTERLDQAKKSIYVVKLDVAVQKLDEAEVMVACVGEVVPRDDLTRLFLYRGVIAFNQGNEVAAMAAFKRALAIDLMLRWDERFGQRPRELFLEAKASVVADARGKVRLPKPAAGVALYVDGEVKPEGGEVELLAGRHLIQIFKDSTFLQGVWFEVPAGGIVVPPLPADAGVVDEPVAARPPSDPVDEPRPQKPKKPAGWWMKPVGFGLSGTGAVLGLTGATTGVIYASTKGQLTSGEYYNNRPSEEKDALLARNAQAALITNIALPSSVVLVGGGVALIVLGAGKSGSEESFSLLPTFDGQHVGFQMSGRF